MSESKSPEALPLSGIPDGACKATKEELRGDGLKVWDDCPLCARYRISCPVGSHPTAASSATATAAPDTFTTPPLLPPKKGRSSVKQDSFKKKLRRRRFADPDSCEICGEVVGYTALEGSHIVDLPLARELEEAYDSERLLPISVNDAANGLLLCPTCHTHFDKAVTKATKNKPKSGRCITISHTGIITLLGEAARVKYKSLQNKKVPWADQIDSNKDYPSSHLLKFANSLKVTQGKRLFELMDQEADDEDNDDKPPRKKQNKKAPSPPPKRSRVNRKVVL